MDLPTVIEVNKTIDNTTLFKSADIAQVLWVHENNEKIDCFNARAFEGSIIIRR